MKKILNLFLTSLLALAVVATPNTEHDENCGYDPITETGCIYETDFFIFPPDDKGPQD